jgi:hypothetical protein
LGEREQKVKQIDFECDAISSYSQCKNIVLRDHERPKQKQMKKYILIIFLTISIIAKGQYYSISTIPFNPNPYTGTNITLGDNSFSPLIPIGFQFCFYGEKFDSLMIGSNGVVTFFELNAIYNYCNYLISDVTLPATWDAYTIESSIMFPWQDLNPSLGGNITYSLSGVTPNRVFVVSFDSIPMDSCAKVFTGQVKLFETTNIIETHLANKDTCTKCNQGRAAHGLQGPVFSWLLTFGDFVTGRNYPNCVWTATNDGIRFTPIVDVCSPLSVNEYSSEQNNFKLYPNPTSTNATLEFDNPKKENCRLTIFNSIGQILLVINDITEDKIVIERQNLTSGFYFFRLDTGIKTIASGKLIIE